MPQLVTWALLREPYNWLIVAAMCAFAVLAVSIITSGGRLPPDQS